MTDAAISIVLTVVSLAISVLPFLVRLAERIPFSEIWVGAAESRRALLDKLSLTITLAMACLKILGLVFSGYAMQILIFGSDPNFQVNFLEIGAVPPVDSIPLLVVLVALNSLVFCLFWHYFFYHFPIIMSGVTKFFGIDDPRKFPKLIDYPYYLFGCLILCHLVVESFADLSIPLILFRIEFIAAILVLTLKFSKVTLEIYPEKYFVEDMKIRGIGGRAFW